MQNLSYKNVIQNQESLGTPTQFCAEPHLQNLKLGSAALNHPKQHLRHMVYPRPMLLFIACYIHIIKLFWLNTNQSLRSSLITTRSSLLLPYSCTHMALQQLSEFMGANHNKGRPIQGSSAGWLIIIPPLFLHS